MNIIYLYVTKSDAGETKACIHKDVVGKLGKNIAVGLVFFVRRPAVLMLEPLPYMITVTMKTLLSVVDAVEALRKRKDAPDEDTTDGYGFLGGDDSEKILKVKFHRAFDLFKVVVTLPILIVS
jgi:hypothetical protein